MKRLYPIAAVTLALHISAVSAFEYVVVLDDLDKPVKSIIMKDGGFHVETGDDGRALITDCPPKSILTAVPVADSASYVVPSKAIPCGLKIKEARLRLERKLVIVNALKWLTTGAQDDDWGLVASAANEVLAVYSEASPQTSMNAELTVYISVARAMKIAPEQAVTFDQGRGKFVIKDELAAEIASYKKRNSLKFTKETETRIDSAFLEKLSGKSAGEIRYKAGNRGSFKVTSMSKLTPGKIDDALSTNACRIVSNCEKPASFSFSGWFNANNRQLAATPAYQDYTVRAKTNDLVIAGNAAKVAVLEYYAEHERFPSSNREANFEMSETKTVQSVSIGVRGVITVTAKPKVSGLGGGSIVFSPFAVAGGIDWKCSGQEIQQEFLPPSCRNNP